MIPSLQCNQVILGDCLEKMKDISDKSIDMILTDLPYGVTSRNKWDEIIPTEPLFRELKRICKGAIVMTSMNPFTSLLISKNYDSYKYEWIWRKQQGTGFLNAKKQPLRNHEQIIVFYENQPTYNPQMTEGKPYKCQSGRASSNYNEQISVLTDNKGERYPLSVLDFKYNKDKLHPTQKPVELFEYMIKTYTNEGNTVLDCCAGSGTTAIACINTNRNYIVIEKDAGYFKIIQDRIKQSSKPLEAFQ